MSQQPGSGQPAGWYNDPYGRFQLRYWGGTAWTEHVSTNGVQQVDPLGTSTIVPFAIPKTAHEAPSPGGGDDATGAGAAAGFATVAAADLPRPPGSGVAGFLEGLGPDSKQRPQPRFGPAVAGLGGALLVIGLLVAVTEHGRGAVVVVALLTLIAAVLIRLVVHRQLELRAAAVGVAVVAIPACAVAATTSSDSVGTGTAFLIAALYLAAWALPGLRGRTVLAGLGALTLVGAFASAAASDNSSAFTGDNGGVLNTSDVFGLPSWLSDSLGTGAVYLIGGVVLLTLVWRLDKAGHHGTATGFAAAGLVASFVGTLLVANDVEGSGAALLVIVAGVIICFVGAHGDRRATTWTGATMTAIGTVAFVAAGFEPQSLGAVASTIILAATLLIGVPILVGAIRASRARGEASAPGPSPLPPPV